MAQIKDSFPLYRKAYDSFFDISFRYRNVIKKLQNRQLIYIPVVH